jgi:hypothetical protein
MVDDYLQGPTHHFHSLVRKNVVCVAASMCQGRSSEEYSQLAGMMSLPGLVLTG